MIINRRRLMGNNSLPYDAEIEYLKSNGTLWINTTWTPDLTKDFHIECKVGWVRNDRGMFLSAWNSNYNLSIELFQQRKFRIFAGSSDVINTPSQPSLNELYYIETRYTANDGACVVTIGSDSYTGNIPIAGRILNTNNIVLGSDPPHRFSYSMFGAIKIYNPNLILDLIPVRVGTTGYMYDKVSKQLFGNAGTGDFILGPDKYDAEIEYLESSGTQFIDTGVYGSETLKTELSVQELSRANGAAIFGSYSSNKNYYLYQSGAGGLWQVGFCGFTNTTATTDTDKHTFLFDDFNVYMDGISIATFQQSSFTTSGELRLFNITGGNYKSVAKRVYYCKMWDNGVLTRDFIPVRVGRTGYLYDKVSGRLFSNEGIGKFILGSDIIMTSESNPEVLAVCHAQGWAANADYMTKAEAEAVTDIGLAFRGNTNITTFNEFKYFTSVILVAAYAFYESSITEIILPPTTTILNDRCFQYCSNLTSINLKTVTTIGILCFYACTSLTKVDLSNCTTCEMGCFCECLNLEDITAVTNIISISSGNYGLFLHTKLSGDFTFTKFTGTTIPDKLFSESSLITGAQFPVSNYTSIGPNAFYSTDILFFVVREGCITLNNHSLSGKSFKFIDLPSTLTTWNGFALYGNVSQKVIVCRALTPPSIGYPGEDTKTSQKSFFQIPDSCKVYVPSASMESYKAADGWRALKDRMLSIEGSWYETHREIDPNDE